MKQNLTSLAKRIKAEQAAIEASFRRGVEHAIIADELLIKAKDQLPHGKWLPWLQKHTGLIPRSAQYYMKLAKRRAEVEANTNLNSHSTITEVLSALSAPALTISAQKTDEAKKVVAECIKRGQNIRMAARAARKLD